MSALPLPRRQPAESARTVAPLKMALFALHLPPPKTSHQSRHCWALSVAHRVSRGLIVLAHAPRRLDLRERNIRVWCEVESTTSANLHWCGAGYTHLPTPYHAPAFITDPAVPFWHLRALRSEAVPSSHTKRFCCYSSRQQPLLLCSSMSSKDFKFEKLKIVLRPAAGTLLSLV